MKRVPVGELFPGMKVAKTIYNSKGNVLISAGMKLKEPYINRLQKLGIESIYIAPEGVPSVNVPEIISNETRMEAVKTVQDTIMEVKGEKSINSKRIQKAVTSIIDEILLDEDKVVHLSDIRNYNSYVFYHSVNVAVLSLLIAIEFNYNRKELSKMAFGALLHDIGLTALDNKDILHKRDSKDFKKHTVYGYEIIKEIDGIHIISAHIAYQHHEILDGSGYPRGLKKEEIIEFAQIVAVANVYDALTSDGNFLERLNPQEALKVLKALGGHKLSFKYVKALVKHIAKYPIGSLVILNNGETAVVVEVNKEDLSSPIVKIIKDKAGNCLEEKEVLDLRKSEEIHIKKLVD